jgi:aminomethyltransferase
LQIKFVLNERFKMPIKSPFFPRMADYCTSLNWKIWAGYYAVNVYGTLHDPEYYAIRNSAALFDVTPLFKYKVSGPDAAAFLSRIMVRDISKLKPGKVTYCCWCTDEGKVVDDGTVMFREENEYFVTAAEPSYSWFSRFTRGYNVTVEDITGETAALSLQGPKAAEILKHIADPGLIDKMKFFQVKKAKIDNFDLYISRTGYTGDLGYELWVPNNHAIQLWDAIMAAGDNYAIRPAGITALDVSRVEAGLVMAGVDFRNALHALIDDRKSSPYEISLGWTVDLERDFFNGQAALKKEKENGSKWATVGLDIDWLELEAVYASYGLPPEVSNQPWRTSIPIYSGNIKKSQIGYATSGTWSPILKKNLALATIESKYSEIGTKVQFEITVEHRRHTATATVSNPQFFNPERKTATPGIEKKKIKI